jgi:hypothetical protein
VLVRAQLTPADEGVTIYFAAADPDDPSANTAPIDSNGSAGNDNRGGAGSLSATSASTNAQGIAATILTVSKQPGDNHKVRGALRAADLQFPERCRETPLLTVWRKLHVVVESMGDEGDFDEFDEDDTLRGDIPQPDTGAFADAFDDCYVTPVVEEDDDQEPWSYNFNGSYMEMTAYLAAHRYDGEGQTQQYEADDYWQVYVIGIYQSSEAAHDNDPNSELCSVGGTQMGDYEVSYFAAEVHRDEADDQWSWTAEEKTHAAQYTVLHEIGHHFGLEHQLGPLPAHVMWAASPWGEPPSDQLEDRRADCPLTFKPLDIATIRGIGHP